MAHSSYVVAMKQYYQKLNSVKELVRWFLIKKIEQYALTPVCVGFQFNLHSVGAVLVALRPPDRSQAAWKQRFPAVKKKTASAAEPGLQINKLLSVN